MNHTANIKLLEHFSLNKAPTATLKECLMSVNKEVLVNIAMGLHKFEFKKSNRKEKLAEQISLEVQKRFELELFYLDEHSLKILNDSSCFNSPLSSLSQMPPAPKLVELIQKNLLFCFKQSETYTLVFPKELQKIVKRVVHSVSFDQKRQRIKEMDSFLTPLIHLYGIVRLDWFKEVWDACFLKKPISTTELTEFFQHYADGRAEEYMFILDSALVPIYLIDFEDAVSLWFEQQSRPTYHPTKEDLEYFNTHLIDERVVEFQDLFHFLNKKVSEVKQDKLKDFLTNLLKTDAKMQDFFISFEHLGNLKLQSEEEINQLTTLYQNAANNTRKWILNGYTPNELFQQQQWRSMDLNTTEQQWRSVGLDVYE